MKILIVNAVYKIKSTGRTYFELSEYAKKIGHECVVVYGNNLGNYQNTYFMGGDLDHKLHALKSRITGKVGCFSLRATNKLIKFIKEYKPDVVHLGNLHGNYVHIPKLLSFLAKNNIPTSITLHDCFFFTGYCTHYTLNKCYKWQEQCKNCKYKEKYMSWFLDRSKYLFNYKLKAFNNNKYLGVIGVSDWITNEAKKSPILNKAKTIKRIYDWVNLDIFKPTQSGIKEKLNIKDKIVLGSIATKWDNSKGLNKILSLASLLPEQYVIILIGNIDKSIQLPNNIIHIDFVDSINKLAELYSMFDVFLQFSLQETFGKVVAEALACGTPAIVFNSTASPELVDGGCGKILELNATEKDIFNAVEEIIRKGKQFYTKNCVNRARELFNKDKNLKRYLASFQKLIEINKNDN